MNQQTYLPLFPLNIVVFPGEKLNLHIFEPRYRELIKDCIRTNTTFGIPSYIHSKISYGTEIKLLKVEKTYEDGKMDVKTLGQRAIIVESFDNPAPGKLYAGGNVTFLPDLSDSDQNLRIKMINLVKELFQTISMVQGVEIAPNINSWDIAHKIGLSQEQEYELLTITSENERMNFIIAHLKGSIPIIREIERAKVKIQMNGHFKNFDALNF
jgi:uncharacterized protein